jgi:hypothetical protein
MSNWLKIAAEQFPDAVRILGNGRYAVANGSVVYLATTEQQQRAISLGIESPVKRDLQPVDFSTIPDLEDADERRKRRRAQQQSAS